MTPTLPPNALAIVNALTALRARVYSKSDLAVLAEHGADLASRARRDAEGAERALVRLRHHLGALGVGWHDSARAAHVDQAAWGIRRALESLTGYAADC